jgi:hypothetical protein
VYFCVAFGGEAWRLVVVAVETAIGKEWERVKVQGGAESIRAFDWPFDLAGRRKLTMTVTSSGGWNSKSLLEASQT